jgi:hypothetical protein
MYFRAASCLFLIILLLMAPEARSQETANPFKPVRPRIILTKQRLNQLSEMIQTRNPWWGRLLDWAEIKTKKKPDLRGHPQSGADSLAARQRQG